MFLKFDLKKAVAVALCIGMPLVGSSKLVTISDELCKAHKGYGSYRDIVYLDTFWRLSSKIDRPRDNPYDRTKLDVHGNVVLADYRPSMIKRMFIICTVKDLQDALKKNDERLEKAKTSLAQDIKRKLGKKEESAESQHENELTALAKYPTKIHAQLVRHPYAQYQDFQGRVEGCVQELRGNFDLDASRALFAYARKVHEMRKNLLQAILKENDAQVEVPVTVSPAKSE